MRTALLTLFVAFCMLTCACEAPMTTAQANQIRDDSMRNPLQQGSHKRPGWSTSGTLQTGVTTNSVHLQANFEDSPGEYTVQFNVDAASNIFFNALATLQWSVEGNTVTRVVTVGNGTSISGVGQGVRVSVVDATSIDMCNIAGQGAAKYGVSISVIQGIRATTQQPVLYTLTEQRASGIYGAVVTNGEPRFIVANGFPVTIQIPQSIGAISFFAHATETQGTFGVPSNGDGLLTAAVNTEGLQRAIVEVDASDTDIWWPLPPAASQIILITGKPGLIIAWNITLGIDG